MRTIICEINLSHSVITYNIYIPHSRIMPYCPAANSVPHGADSRTFHDSGWDQAEIHSQCQSVNPPLCDNAQRYYVICLIAKCHIWYNGEALNVRRLDSLTIQTFWARMACIRCRHWRPITFNQKSVHRACLREHFDLRQHHFHFHIVRILIPHGWLMYMICTFSVPIRLLCKFPV